ncbi:NGG1p interacting factor NIF3 [Candidatus Parcubacteria bacterium]|nr:MAG: NGG1p interacting factor NIF3 [Candidatus Parcubacteria bacterium]
MGMAHDPRGQEIIKEGLKRLKEKFDKLSESEKEWFDKDKLWNPYGDTRLLFSASNQPLKRVLAGIDIEGPELLAAKFMPQSVDAAIAHHPQGKAFVRLAEMIVEMSGDLYERWGVPPNVSEGIMNNYANKLTDRLRAANKRRWVDLARLLWLGYLCVHTPADNLAQTFVSRKIKQKRVKFVGEVVEILTKIEEFKNPLCAPRVVVGHQDARCGRVCVFMTGGVEPPPEFVKYLVLAGVGTLVAMHIRDEYVKQLQQEHINVVTVGHMAADSLGMNLLLDELEKRGTEIIPCSGLIRVRRF